MSKYNFDYAALGFKNEAELQESISRVERKMKMNSDDLVREEIKERHARSNQPFSIEAIEEGARLEGLDRLVRNQIQQAKEEAKAQAQAEEQQKLMQAFSDSVTAEKEAKAQREMQKAKAEAEAELQQEIYSKYNVKTDKEKAIDEDLKKMLAGLNK